MISFVYQMGQVNVADFRTSLQSNRASAGDAQLSVHCAIEKFQHPISLGIAVDYSSGNHLMNFHPIAGRASHWCPQQDHILHYSQMVCKFALLFQNTQMRFHLFINTFHIWV